jgi:antitoxin VapB
MQPIVAKVFKCGNSQAIRLPKEFRLTVRKVYVSRSGDTLLLTPRRDTWEGFSEGFTGLSTDFDTSGGLGKDVRRERLT